MRAHRCGWLMAMLLVTAPLPGAAASPIGMPPLQQLSWMTGHWVSRSEAGASSEEIWLSPQGGSMPGLNREVTRSGRTHFEFLRIEQRDDGRIVYVASPGGGPSTEFTLTQWDRQSATFENPEHDFPRTLTYWREGDTLHARVVGEERGGARQLLYRWRLRNDP